MGCDQYTFPRTVERYCADCGVELTYRDSFTSCECSGELRYFHIGPCPH